MPQTFSTLFLQKAHSFSPLHSSIIRNLCNDPCAFSATARTRMPKSTPESKALPNKAAHFLPLAPETDVQKCVSAKSQFLRMPEWQMQFPQCNCLPFFRSGKSKQPQPAQTQTPAACKAAYRNQMADFYTTTAVPYRRYNRLSRIPPVLL